MCFGVPGDVADGPLFDRLLGHSSWGFSALRLRRIQRHLQQVAEDDALLIQEDMGKHLSQAELQAALDERGMYVEICNVLHLFALLIVVLRNSVTNGLTPTQWQSRLQWWLQHVSSDSQPTDPVARRVLLVASSGLDRF